MQALVGLFLFSVLLTTGASLKCQTCAAQGNRCTGQEQTCGAGLDTCLTLVIESTAGGKTITAVSKGCNSKATCDLLKPGQAYKFGDYSGTIKEVTCKAPSASASLLLALSGLLLLKVLF